MKIYMVSSFDLRIITIMFSLEGQALRSVITRGKNSFRKYYLNVAMVFHDISNIIELQQSKFI